MPKSKSKPKADPETAAPVAPLAEEAREAEAVPVEPPPAAAETSNDEAPATGLDLARRIEATVERVHRARAHAGHAPRSHRRRRATRQLRRLGEALARLQAAAIDGALSDRDGHALLAHLVAVDAEVERFLDQPPKRRALRRVRRAMRRRRHAIDGSFTPEG